MTKCFPNMIFAEVSGESITKRTERDILSPFDDDHDDDGVEESLRRSREMDQNPAMSLTEEEFFASFEEYRGK